MKYAGYESSRKNSSEMRSTLKSGTFHGPLELLLDLVESRKFFINELALSSVTEDFLKYAKELPKNNLSELTSFVSIASTLILIKSRSLLPGFVVTKEEEADIKDLERRLSLYAMMKEIGKEISDRYGKTVIHFSPTREIFESVFAPDPKLSIDLLRANVLEVLNRVPKEEILPQVKVRKIISIEEMLSSLEERIASATKISFRDWQNSVSSEDKQEMKTNVIVSFLAVLELVRNGIMDALQQGDFEDIELSKLEEARTVDEFNEA